MKCEFCGALNGQHNPTCKIGGPTIPTVWRTSDGRAIINDSPVVAPDMSDAKLLESAHNVCGTCKYFELIEGQKLMEAQKFVERLVREDKWRVHHLASPLNQLGICGAASNPGGDETITGKMTKACDQWRDAKGGFSLRKRLEDRR